MRACWRCGREYGEEARPYFHDICEGCGTPWHSCRNCAHHDRGKPNECRVPGTEHVPDREKDNFCEEYDLADRPRAKADGGGGQAKFDALFGPAGGEPKKPGDDDPFAKLFRPP